MNTVVSLIVIGFLLWMAGKYGVTRKGREGKANVELERIRKQNERKQ